jgi:hypothetical protein
MHKVNWRHANDGNTHTGCAADKAHESAACLSVTGYHLPSLAHSLMGRSSSSSKSANCRHAVKALNKSKYALYKTQRSPLPAPESLRPSGSITA